MKEPMSLVDLIMIQPIRLLLLFFFFTSNNLKLAHSSAIKSSLVSLLHHFASVEQQQEQGRNCINYTSLTVRGLRLIATMFQMTLDFLRETRLLER